MEPITGVDFLIAFILVVLLLMGRDLWQGTS